MNVIEFDLKELEKEHNGFSYYILGRSYDLEENGVSENYKKALEFYKKGVEIDYPLCLYALGVSYEFGLGNTLKENKEKANFYLTKAYPLIVELINKNSTSDIERLYAKFVLGAYFYFGLGNVKQDYNKAFKIIEYCAKNGHIAAIYDLGANFYYNGVGIEKNIELAGYYLNIATSHNLKRAIELSNKRKNGKK